jgi:DNA-binding MarR family transcriptional regulator
MDYNETADEVVATLRQIIRAIDLQSKKLTKQYGLTGPQLIILKEIKKAPNRPISEISRKVSLSQATVTAILNRLEQQGFAIRQRSELDKRKVNLLLTDKALKILKDNPPLLQEEFSNKFDKLEEWEKYMLLSSLQRMASMMNAENIDAPPVLVSGPIAATSQEVKRYLEEEKQ